jgi:hypothetical protein
MAAGTFELIHRGPSKAELMEMPEADFSRARVGSNCYADQAVEAVSKIQYGGPPPPRTRSADTGAHPPPQASGRPSNAKLRTTRRQFMPCCVNWS